MRRKKGGVFNNASIKIKNQIEVNPYRATVGERTLGEIQQHNNFIFIS